MNDPYSEAAAALLRRVSERSRTSQPAPQPATTHIDRVIINRAVNCTFIFGAGPAGHDAPPSAGQPTSSPR